MQLKKATITNYKGITHAEIPFTKHMVLLQGKNGSGKSSLIDGIISCLGGVDSKTVKDPIKHGEKKATNILEFEEGIITRTFTEGGSNSIKLVFNDGKEIRGIGKIAEYIGCSSFDPMVFTRMNDKEQRETILKLSGVDLTEADKAIEEAESMRLQLHRAVEAIPTVGNIEAQEVQAFVGKEEVSVVKLAEELQIKEEGIAKWEANNLQIPQIKASNERILDDIKAHEKKIVELKQEHANNLCIVADIDKIIKPEDNREDLKKQMETAEETNTKIRKAKELAIQVENKKEASKAHNAQDTVVKEARVAKTKLLDSASMPVKGLSVDEVVKFNGVPFRQINTAQQILVGVKIALSDPANKLKFVYIEQGSELDSDSIEELQALVDMCRAGGVKVNILIGQMKDKKQENGFFLEEGQVVL